MGRKRRLVDPDDIKWIWIGEGKKGEDNDNVYYESAEVTRISDNSKRKFKIGDTVCVAGGGKRGWISQIVELFESDDYPNDTMRCTLRWLYDPPSEVVNKPFSMHPDGREVYFSDHVEISGSNSLESIQGRSFLYRTVLEMNKAIDNPPDGYWEGDVICLVRFFYYCEDQRRVRFKKGELQSLIDNPSTDTLHDVIAPSVEGTGSQETLSGFKLAQDPVPGDAEGQSFLHNVIATSVENTGSQETEPGPILPSDPVSKDAVIGNQKSMPGSNSVHEPVLDGTACQATLPDVNAPSVADTGSKQTLPVPNPVREPASDQVACQATSKSSEG